MSLTEVLGNGSKVQCRKYRKGVKSAYSNAKTEVQHCADARIGVQNCAEKYLVVSVIEHSQLMAQPMFFCTVLYSNPSIHINFIQYLLFKY
jgi:hypothetical protein